MVDLNVRISIMTLIGYSSIKTNKHNIVGNWKQDPTMCYLQKIYFKHNDTVWKKYSEKDTINQNKTGRLLDSAQSCREAYKYPSKLYKTANTVHNSIWQLLWTHQRTEIAGQTNNMKSG